METFTQFNNYTPCHIAPEFLALGREYCAYPRMLDGFLQMMLIMSARAASDVIKDHNVCYQFSAVSYCKRHIKITHIAATAQDE